MALSKSRQLDRSKPKAALNTRALCRPLGLVGSRQYPVSLRVSYGQRELAGRLLRYRGNHRPKLITCYLDQGPRAPVRGVDELDEVDVRVIEDMDDRAALTAGKTMLW